MNTYLRRVPRCQWQSSFRCSSSGATVAPAPPLLFKLRNDMKDAMKARDTNRLNVLRTLLAEITNASKTSNPIKTDLQLLSLLRKRAAASRSAAEEFSNANRGDLQEKELAQVSVLESYAKGVDLIGEEEMKDAASSSIERLKADGAQITLGPVLRSLIGPGGVLENKHVDKAQLSAIVKGLL